MCFIIWHAIRNNLLPSCSLPFRFDDTLNTNSLHLYYRLSKIILIPRNHFLILLLTGETKFFISVKTHKRQLLGISSVGEFQRSTLSFPGEITQGPKNACVRTSDRLTLASQLQIRVA